MPRDDSKWKRIADLFEEEIDGRLKVMVTVNENLVDHQRFIDVRHFWRVGDRWQASKKGISMPLHEWEVVAAVIQTWLDDNA